MMINAYLVVIGALLIVPLHSVADCPPCGPRYCLGDPDYPNILDKKKDLLKNDYPNRLVYLINRDGKCVACVEDGPDGFSMLIVEERDNYQIMQWTEDAERIAKDQLKEREIQEYLIFNARQSCACCNESQYDERKDYDQDLEINRNMAIQCKYNTKKQRVECL